MTYLKPVAAAVLAAALLIGAGPGQAGNNTSLLNPNLATAEELAGLPQIDAALAAAIVEERPFLSMSALNTFLSRSLNDQQLAELYARVWVPINLNDVSDAEILLIPGVGDRMAHEFEEYRPYRALAQFRREIGKYVDDDEVARLEQYVFVPIDLNSASRDDILTIPGVGDRMAHEFEEYRPYVSIQQFRREIGKYVDDDQVARLERYVTIR